MNRSLRLFLLITLPLYLLLVIYVMFASRTGRILENATLIEYITSLSNFIPLKTILSYIRAIFSGSLPLHVPLVNLGVNLIMFIPMGLYLPCIFKMLRPFGWYTLCMVVILFVLETVQMLFRVGSFDIDDVILGLAGAWIGFAMWKSRFVQSRLNIE